MDIAALSCCVLCRTDLSARTLNDVKIAFGVAAPTPFRCVETESKLKGMAVDDRLYDKIEESVDVYKRQV